MTQILLIERHYKIDTSIDDEMNTKIVMFILVVVCWLQLATGNAKLMYLVDVDDVSRIVN